jgi:hypothetical protein
MGSMKFKYVHDAVKEIVYRFPVEPKIQQRKKGRILGAWVVSMDIDITRADNRLDGNRYQFATTDRPCQYFENNRYSRDRMISHFLTHHEPIGEKITEDIYMMLRQKYEARIKNRL